MITKSNISISNGDTSRLKDGDLKSLSSHLAYSISITSVGHKISIIPLENKSSDTQHVKVSMLKP